MSQPSQGGAPELPIELLKVLLSYDKDTGLFKWRIRKSSRALAGAIAGTKTLQGYWQIRIDGYSYRAHRLALAHATGEWPDKVDHINGVRDDNRYVNLRNTTTRGNAQNIRNPRHNNKSGLLGASQFKGRKTWVSRITIDGKDKYLGTFTTKEQANAAYLSAKRTYHPTCTI